MRIIHTADWHLGKRLYEQDLLPDQRLFLDWLLSYLRSEEIQLLLISGDVFDHANPSSEARALYFQFLAKLSETNCKAIITGGNHDSPAVLNGPKSLLQSFGFHVVGAMPNTPSEAIFAFDDPMSQSEVVVLAIPYLRESDWRTPSANLTADERIQAMKEGIAQTYHHLAKEASLRYPGATLIAMGHLYAAGTTLSDSEREIQIGNLASIGTEAFPRSLKYVALGHLHRPQEVGGNSRIRYSGSPISLSFSEHEDRKELVRIDTDGRIVYVKPVQIPTFRTLIRVTGNLQELETSLRAVLPSIYRLPAWAEVELVLEQANPIEIAAFEQWVNHFQHPHVQIIRHRVKLNQASQTLRWSDDPGIRLEDLQPIDVFRKRLDQTSLTEEERLVMEQTFKTLLQETMEEDGQ